MIKKKSLTSEQQTFLRLLESFVYIAVISFLLGASQYLSNHEQIDWNALVYIAGAQALLAVVLAIANYFKSLGNAQDLALGDVVEQIVTQIADRLHIQIAQQIAQQQMSLTNDPEHSRVNIPAVVQSNTEQTTKLFKITSSTSSN